MITPISFRQSTVNFEGVKLKTPQKAVSNVSPKDNNLKNKISDSFQKIKTEFDNLDQESRELLYKSVILGSIIIGAISYVIHWVNIFIEKFQNLFE